MACAPTGSGKTCAFMVPSLQALLNPGRPSSASGRMRPSPRVLVLAPTHELARQTYEQSVKFCNHTSIQSCVVHGGEPIPEQRRRLKGCDVLVATPGRLIDLCRTQCLSLRLVRFLILDEADTMLDMGFEPQVREIVEQTDMPRKSQRQSMMFSATFSENVEQLAKDFLNDHLFIRVGCVGAAANTVIQKVVYGKERVHKIRTMCQELRDMSEGDLALVFAETKAGVDALELELHAKGFPVCAIHGGRSQADRELALATLKEGRKNILVATGVAARGLDIPNVSLVIIFDMPSDLDNYVQRIGRTGRAGRIGVAVSMIDHGCPYLPELEKQLQTAKQSVIMDYDHVKQEAINAYRRTDLPELQKLLRWARQEVPTWFHELCQKVGPVETQAGPCESVSTERKWKDDAW